MLDALAELLRPVSAPWADFKLSLSSFTGMSPDALHVLGGLMFLAVCGLAMHRQPLSRGPLLALFLVAAINEGLDLTLDGMGSTEATLGASLHDLVSTMIGPLLLASASRFVRLRSA